MYTQIQKQPCFWVPICPSLLLNWYTNCHGFMLGWQFSQWPFFATLCTSKSSIFLVSYNSLNNNFLSSIVFQTNVSYHQVFSFPLHSQTTSHEWWTLQIFTPASSACSICRSAPKGRTPHWKPIGNITIHEKRELFPQWSKYSLIFQYSS